jgi:exopolysaccharide biosynthesis polyprenyl glycosylphosphotransferase
VAQTNEMPTLIVEAGSDAVILQSAAPAEVSQLVTADRSHGREVPMLLLVDALSLLLSMCVGLIALRWFWPARTNGPQFPRVLLFIPAFLTGLALHGVYWQHRQRLRRSAVEQVKRISLALGTGVLIALAADAVVGSTSRSLKLSEAVAFALPAIVLVPVGRAAYFHLFPVRNPTRLLIVGNGPGTAKLQDRLQRCSELSVVGIVDDAAGPDDALIGDLSALRQVVRAHHVEWVVVGFPSCDWQRTVEQLRQLPSTVNVAVVPRYYELISWRSGVEDLHGLPVLHIASAQLSAWSRAAKRAFDIILATVGTALLSPLLAAAAIAIKLDSPGPVFFRQARAGKNGETFRIFKFRTMRDGAEQLRSELADHNEVDGPIFKIRADPRITRVGAFLRRTSLDELPQLLNVIAGTMSLVGPRPFPVEEARQIEGPAAIRQNVLPGMTGLWQVSGRSDLTYEDLEHLDALYVSSWSLFWDLRIILQTPSTILAGRGAF